MDDKYLETLNFVVSFLHQEGFKGAHRELLSELQSKYRADSPSSQKDRSPSQVTRQSSGVSPSQSTGCSGLDPLDYESDSGKATQELASPWVGFPEPGVSLMPSSSAKTSGSGAASSVPGASLPEPQVDLSRHNSSGTSSRLNSTSGAGPSEQAVQALGKRSTRNSRKGWDTSLDEYDNMDDPGYCRKDIVGQQRFIEQELDQGSEEGSERNYFMHPAGEHLNYESITDACSSEDGEAEEGAAPNSRRSSSGVFDQTPVVGQTSSHAADETWDLGPIGIKFAEPVTTPSKSPEKPSPEESRPVLSRVESLSSSFKDFELERGAEEEGQAPWSSKVSEAEYTADPEVIDFPVTTEQPFVSHEDVEFLRQTQHSRTSSLDVGASSASVNTFNEPPDPRGKGGKTKSPLFQPAAGQEPKESGGGFGFSFPVTPTLPADEPDSKLFRSWPSVRSSCTSEPHANSDDDNALAAEYADDDYSRSKLSSRSTSMVNQDLTSKALEEACVRTKAQSAPSSPAAHSQGAPVAAAAGASSVLRPTDFEGPRLVVFSPGSLQTTQADINLTPSPSSPSAGKAPCASTLSPGQIAAGRSTPFPSASPLAPGATPDTHKQASSPKLELEVGSVPAPEPPSSTAVALQLPLEVELCEDDADEPAPREPSLHLAMREVAPEADTPSATGPCSVSRVSARDAEAAPMPIQQPQRQDSKGAGEDVVAHMISLSPDDHEHDHEHDPDNEQYHEALSASMSDVMDSAVAGAATARSDDEHDLMDDDDDDDDSIDDDDEDDEDEADEGVGIAPEAPEPQAHRTWIDGAEDRRSKPSGSTEGGQLMPRYTLDEQGTVMYEYDADYIERKYEVFELRIIHRRQRTGFEETKDFPIRLNDLIAGRYQVMDFLGSAAFSRAVQALDVKTGQLVCLKIIKNNKDYFDQSLDEIKLLKYVNSMDPNDEYAIVRLYDFFYYKEHLFLVCELLRANLYEFQKYNKDSGDELYFTNARIQRIARQVLRSLAFLHSLGLIHSDLKPENILIKSYSRCEVKVIDLGSSCFITDQLSSYVQSRSYRAPEVILGLPYEHKVDVWSLGCILAELSSGFVLFQNDSLATLLARLEGILGPVPEWMLNKGRYTHRFFTRSGMLYERNPHTQRYELLTPKRTSLRHRIPDADEGLLDFVQYLLCIDPRKRPSAAEALNHPWLSYQYPE